jgi:hypothetical protein
VFEVSGDRDRRLWLDAGQGTAGVYLLTRDEARRASVAGSDAVAGSTRHALLLFRKHLAGVRVTGLRRVAGERTLLLEAGGVIVAARCHGSAPAFTLVVEGTAVATLGGGPAAWPVPAEQPARDWDRIAPEAIEAAFHEARAAGRPPHRAIAAACPALGPLLARELDGSRASLDALRSRLRAPRPTLLSPGPLAECDDADLAPAGALALVPIALGDGSPAAPQPRSWREAAATFLAARHRGDAFAARRRTMVSAARREVSRLSQLADNLSRDLDGLPDPAVLRRRAEALLASPEALVPGATEADVADPGDPSRRLRFPVDARLPGPANADRLFEKARRIERARLEVGERMSTTRAELAKAREREAAVASARQLEALGPAPAAEKGGVTTPWAGPRRYLTGRGLTLLVGRGARENHHLTFSTARPEDLWLHARDVPGAHVVLRDDEGRAGPEDIREAAEVAAFFSEAREQARVDVHVARRKHVRPAGSGPGRVRIAHSETVRAAPRDPEGRLRRR